MLTAESLSEVPRVGHAFFTRRGGVSEGLYASLNCGFGSSDARGRVAENRSRAAGRLGLEQDRLVTPFQIHSAEVVRVERPWTREDSPHADALVTDRPGIALGVLSADCAPVLLASRAGGKVIGAAHAGWKGALAGVLEAVVSAMEELGARRGDIAAVVGPAIAQESYEVGPEFPRAFLDQSGDNGRFFAPARRAGHFMFDLPGYCAERLGRLGLAKTEILERDTCAEPADFFSYRRACLAGEPRYGRGLSAIVMEA